MTTANKPYDTTPRLDSIIQEHYPSSQVYLTAYNVTQFLTDFGKILDSKSYDQS